jgi:hypothetical protein
MVFAASWILCSCTELHTRADRAALQYDNTAPQPPTRNKNSKTPYTLSGSSLSNDVLPVTETNAKAKPTIPHQMLANQQHDPNASTSRSQNQNQKTRGKKTEKQKNLPEPFLQLFVT